MKIAISGKGGVGKTLLSAFLIRAFAIEGWEVIAIDADPDANLAATLGFPDSENIVPISNLKKLIDERTETNTHSGRLYFKLNPSVDDLPEIYATKHDGIRLMVMGEMKRGGGGCYCPENTFLGSLMAHLLLARQEVVVMDMSAGIEHLSRGTAQSVDMLIIVVEPGHASLHTARRIKQLALDLGLKNVAIVGNKVRTEAEKSYILKETEGLNFMGFIPYDPTLIELQMKGISAIKSKAVETAVHAIYKKITIPVKT